MISDERLLSTILLYGKPPVRVRGSCTQKNGYWVNVAKGVAGKDLVSFNYVKCVYSRWKRDTEMQNRVESLMLGIVYIKFIVKILCFFPLKILLHIRK